MLANKIKKIPELKNITTRLKTQGKKIVFTNGCFDILHYGHVKYLEAAKSKADILVVAINSDSSVKKIKGKFRPINQQSDRAKVLAALEAVDYVTIFNEPTPLKAIRALGPDVLVKGSDWKKTDIVGAAFVASYGGKVETIPFVGNYSTTAILKKIANRSR